MYIAIGLICLVREKVPWRGDRDEIRKKKQEQNYKLYFQSLFFVL